MDAQLSGVDDASSSIEGSEQLERVLEQLAQLRVEIAEFHERSAHRETVIDRLHAENQELRAGVHRALLDPVVVDLVRLYEALGNEATRAKGTAIGTSPAMMASFADDVELILNRCGLEQFGAQPGDPYCPGEHKPLAVVPTDDPRKDRTVAEVIAPGFREHDTGRARRPLQARFFQYTAPGERDGAEPTPG